jgi:hypothetical protein
VETSDHGGHIVYHEPDPESSGGSQARCVQAAAATGLCPSGEGDAELARRPPVPPQRSGPTRAALSVACCTTLTTGAQILRVSTRAPRRRSWLCGRRGFGVVVHRGRVLAVGACIGGDFAFSFFSHVAD